MSTIRKQKLKFNDSTSFKVSVESYSSANELVNDCKTRPVLISDYGGVEKRDMTSDFEGVQSYDEALNLLNFGYQPTVDKLKSSLKANRKGTSKRIAFENNVYGFAPVVPLAIKGVPQNMINMTMKPIKCKVIDIYYDIGVSWYVDSDKIIDAGQKLLSAIVELEKQGYRFNLYAWQSYSNSHDADILCVKVKSSDKPIDLKRISFPLTHPAFFRVIGFDWQGKSPATKYRGGGRGQPLKENLNREHTRELAKQVFGDNAVYLACTEIMKEDEQYIKEVLVK